MDSFELNKIAGAVLGTLMFIMGIGILSGILFTQKKPVVPGYALPGEVAVVAPVAAGPAIPLPELLAKADAAKGENAAKKCLSCHSFEKGGPNKVGPNLWNIVGRAKGSMSGAAYSAAMKGTSAKGEAWSFADLYSFIESPKKAMPGTSMAFAGVPKSEERGDLIAYLRKLSDNPQPLPQ
jgi:cytochrome c